MMLSNNMRVLPTTTTACVYDYIKKNLNGDTQIDKMHNETQQTQNQAAYFLS